MDDRHRRALDTARNLIRPQPTAVPRTTVSIDDLRALVELADNSPSHGMFLVIQWEGDAEPDIQRLPPGISLSLPVPDGQRIRRIEVGPWEQPPPHDVRYERGYCVACQTECSREEGTETWYNFYGRSECKAWGLEGPHDVQPIAEKQA